MRSLFQAVTVLALASTSALASSHREAPFITKNPKVDGTDFYLFNSYESGRGAFVTLIANYQPLQDAYGGPNYFSMDPDALYEIHIDNTGEGVEDLTFQFRFQNTLTNGTGVALPIGLPDGGSSATVAIPLINAGPAMNPASGFQGQLESYTVNVVRGPRRSGTVSAVTHGNGLTSFAKPLDNIGAKTFPNGYAAYASQFVYSDVTIPGCSTAGSKIFVGQRAEGFAVNLGTVFDLINAPVTVITDPSLRGAVPNPIANKNVTTIALEIPKACLTGQGQTVIGGWTTASVRQARVVNPGATYSTPAREGGAWTQVSRLGMPLVNEVVIGVPDKNKFNASEPKDDAANFATYVTNPTLPALIEILFPAAPAPRFFPRTDLVTAFLTGIPGVNAFTAPQGQSFPPTEMVRLNTAIPATVAASQNDLGAAGCVVRHPTTPATIDTSLSSCDPAGFPNGRRPGDDVVDVALRVSMGVLLPENVSPAGAVPLHDAVLQNASQFDTTFPYLKTPNAGTGSN